MKKKYPTFFSKGSFFLWIPDTLISVPKKKRGTRLFLFNNTTNHSCCLFIIQFEKLYNDPVHFRPRECS